MFLCAGELLMVSFHVMGLRHLFTSKFPRTCIRRIKINAGILCSSIGGSTGKHGSTDQPGSWIDTSVIQVSSAFVYMSLSYHLHPRHQNPLLLYRSSSLLPPLPSQWTPMTIADTPKCMGAGVP